MNSTEVYPRVDIVCPSRNSSLHIEKMIASVLSQDYENVSLFIQDGGSTDNTLSILDKYPVKWHSEKDNGISQALNRAIAATDGDIIGFTSSDDLLEKGAITAAVDEFRDPGVIIVYGDCFYMNSEGSDKKLWKSNKFDLDKLFWKNFIPYQTVYIRRSSLSVTGVFDENLKLAQDYDLWLRFGAYYNKNAIKYIPKVLASYRMSFNSAGLSDHHTLIKCLDAAVTKFFNIPGATEKLSKSKNYILAGNYLMKSNYFLLDDDLKSSQSFFLKSLVTYPLAVISQYFWKQLIRLILGKKLTMKLK